MALKPEIKVLPHQVQGIGFLLRHNYALCGDEQGVGKTLQAIAVQQATKLDCLVICPATLKYNWLEEYEKFTDEKNIRVGTKKAKINIVNYENLFRCTELFMKADMIIIDEAHYLIHMDSARTKYAHKMIEKYKPERLIELTGTPVKNRVTDFYSLLRILSYTSLKNNGRSIMDRFPTQGKFNNYFAHKETFMVEVKKKRGGSFKKKITKFVGLKNERELKAYMRFKYVRRLASKVLSLPPVVYKNVVASYKESPELEREWRKHQAGKTFNVSVKAEAACLNAPFTADYVKDVFKDGERPIVIFSDHLEPLNVIAHKLKKFKVGVITGEETDMRKRQDTVNNFQEGLLDFLLCTYGAGATGLNMTRARNMVLNDLSWDAAAMSQAVKRIDRIGQTRKCIIHRIIGNRAGKRISKDLEMKMRDINKIV